MKEQFALFRESHVLSDGTHVTVRALLPEDRPALASAFEHASPDTLRSRFLSDAFRPNAEILRYLTEVDGVDHVAIVATVDSLDLKREIGVGVARFIRLEDASATAEAAVTVDGSMRRRGLAKVLLGALAQLATERGITHFRAYVLGDNQAVHTALGNQQGVMRYREGDVWVYDLPIVAAPATKDSPFAHALRYVSLATDKVLVLLRALPFRASSGATPVAAPAHGERTETDDEH